MTGRQARRLTTIVRRFPRARILVVGDLMLDQFVWGRVQRISPEAPVPVVEVTSESFHLGGAANVVANVRDLGGQVGVVGVVGRDEPGRRVVTELEKIGADVTAVLRSRNVATIRKTRILAHQQQVVRLDREATLRDPRMQRDVLARVERSLTRVNGVIVSDYNKGVVHPELLAFLADRPSGKPPVFVDPKRRNFPHYRGATLMKPNLEAAAAASGLEITDERSLREAGERLVEAWGAEAILLSRGDEGMTLFRAGESARHIPTVAREVYDVTGAGDTVMATASLALSVGATFEEAAILANHAAGIVVGKVGTATATAKELLADLRREAAR